MQRCFKKNQNLVKGTSNLSIESMQPTGVFKIDVFFVSLKEEISNKSVSEILQSLPLKTFSSMLRLLLGKIDLSSEKIRQ